MASSPIGQIWPNTLTMARLILKKGGNMKMLVPGELHTSKRLLNSAIAAGWDTSGFDILAMYGVNAFNFAKRNFDALICDRSSTDQHPIILKVLVSSSYFAARGIRASKSSLIRYIYNNKRSLFKEFIVSKAIFQNSKKYIV